MTPSRNTIMDALKAKVVAGGYFVTVSRRLKTWDQVPASEQPACFLYEHTDPVTHQSETFAKNGIDVEVFIYTRCDNQDEVPAAILNDALDALDAALTPTGADLLRRRQTLGNLVSHCFVDGDIMKEPGDQDNQGVAIVPLKILVP